MPQPKKKLPADLGSLCRGYTDLCIRSLGNLVANAESESARVAAIAILLDRGWGKAQQPVTGADGGDIRITIRNIIEEAKSRPPATITVIPNQRSSGNGSGA